MRIKEAQAQWLRRAYEIAFTVTQNPEFSTAFASKMLTQSRLNPTHNSPEGVGIAQLDPTLAADVNVDPLNPEDALQFAAQRDAEILNQTGDITAAMVGPDAQADPVLAQKQLQEIQENSASVEQALFATGQEEGTFTELDSPETRFRNSVKQDDLGGTTNVIDEMIDSRVSHRAATR